MKEKNRKLVKSITDALKVIVILAFLIAVIGITIVSINYTIDHNLVNMDIYLKNEKVGEAVVIPSQDSAEAILQEVKPINPIEHLKTISAPNISVKAGEEITLLTNKSFLIETRESKKPIFISAYKNGKISNKEKIDPKIVVETKKYDIKLFAPKEKGVYTYYMALRFNRYDAEYMFNLEVK